MSGHNLLNSTEGWKAAEVELTEAQKELLEKYDSLDKENMEIHFIGHLQTNKVKYIIDKVSMIHSVDSYKLAAEINKRAAQHGIVMDILIQVNSAMEESKFGITTEETAYKTKPENVEAVTFLAPLEVVNKYAKELKEEKGVHYDTELTVDDLKNDSYDCIMVLGAGGKMGPSLCLLAKTALPPRITPYSASPIWTLHGCGPWQKLTEKLSVPLRHSFV